MTEKRDGNDQKRLTGHRSKKIRLDIDKRSFVVYTSFALYESVFIYSYKMHKEPDKTGVRLVTTNNPEGIIRMTSKEWQQKEDVCQRKNVNFWRSWI